MPKTRQPARPDAALEVEATIDLLLSKNPERKLRGIRQLRHPFSAPAIQELVQVSRHSHLLFKVAAKSELDTLDVRFRKQIHKIRENLQKKPEYPGYQLALSVVFLRYSQIWPHSPENRTYFLNQSLTMLNRLIRLVRPELKYFYYRGFVRKEIGDFRSAVSDFRKVLHFKPGHWGAFLGLLECLFELGEFNKIQMVIQYWPGQIRHPYPKDLLKTWTG